MNETLHGQEFGNSLQTPWLKPLLAGLLIAAAMLISAIGQIASPRSMPDERHHYALVKYAAENGWIWDYRQIHTDPQADANHLMHPPLYYWVMSRAYRLLQPGRHFTDVGLAHDQYGSPASHRAAIPVMRSLSLFLILAGLAGVWRLCLFLVGIGWLTPIAAIGFAVLTSFIPGYLYIAAALNNDVMGFLLWPFLTHAGLAWLHGHRPRHFWQTLILIGLAVLSKATLWVMALGFCLLLAYGWFRQKPSASSHPRPGLAVFFWAPPHRWWMATALLCLTLAAFHLGRNRVLYGAFQPAYQDVFEIPVSQSKFFHDPEAKLFPARIHLIGAHAWASVCQTVSGALGHTEDMTLRGSVREPAQLLAGLLLAIVAALWLAKQANQVQHRAILFCASLWLIQFAVLWQVNLDFYRDFSRLAAEGRYFIGYFHLAVLGLAMAASQRQPSARIPRFTAWLAMALLAPVLVKPTQFINQTWEFFRRSDMASIIEKQLAAEGFKRIPWETVHPTQDDRQWVKRSRAGIPSHLVLSNSALTFSGLRIPPKDAAILQVTIWCRATTSSPIQVTLGALSNHAELASPLAGIPWHFTANNQPQTFTTQLLQTDGHAGPVSFKLDTAGHQPLQIFGIYYRWLPPNTSDPAAQQQ